MKNALVLFCVFALAVTVAFNDASAQGKKKSKMPTQEEMMKKWGEAMTPGPAHKNFEQFVGTWDVETKMWMNGPKGEARILRNSVARRASGIVRRITRTVKPHCRQRLY